MLVIIGYLTAEDELYKIKRQNIVVLSNDNATLKNDEMNYNSFHGIKISKRKDGRWQARIPLGHGERQYIYGNTQKDCYEKLKENVELNNIKVDKDLSLFEYWEQWYNKYKLPFYSKKTLHNYQSVFENQIKPNFKDKKIKAITALEINMTIKDLKNTRMKEFTCQYLRELFKQAYRDKKIKIDFWEEIRTYHHKRKEGCALTQSQRKILFEKARNTIYDIFIFYLFTGCRPAEGRKVLKSDFENGMLHIHGTKTENSDRWIPVLQPVQEIYDRYKKTKTKSLFDISETTLKRRLTDFKKICGFKFQTKDLRTTFATMCAEKGVAPKIIAKWLGHTTTNTTNKYYIKVLDDYEKEQAGLLDTNFDTNKSEPEK